MFIFLAGTLYSSRVMAKPLVSSVFPLQVTSFLSRATSNATMTCTFNGSNYSLLSPSLDNVTCDAIMHDAAAALQISSNDRSVTDIIWSCLATVFACTWVSVHPNIPHPDATDWYIRRERALLMLCGLIAPELIVLWALRQWMGARYSVRKMKEESIYGFTMVHGHFWQMGGFIQNELGHGARVILDDHELARFKLPTVGEIRDKSKGDGLSKALVVGQTAWFVAQCIARWAMGLAVTEAELVTLAFAALNGVIYFLWWHKPQDVRYAIQVGGPPGSAERQYPPQLTASLTLSTDTPSIQSIQPLPAFEQRGYVDDLQNIRSILAESFLGKLAQRLKTSQPSNDDFCGSWCLAISMSHSTIRSDDSFTATGVASSVGVLFGALHCAAWNFDFLTPKERI
ncbi:hypothetical protein D9619_012265 [Psilocybe cf. subviscida]|uniref:Uncharacterized protein n=1 Tax=Psilocybe cf. subviscida TaxID=2480587 RepID=A0A8H5EZ70_9AGAR|nr:hypothetical protein D9619_012265 [Psilocybe cf. subviscida]